MTESQLENVWSVDLPWSAGCMSAKLWQKGKRTVVSVPELGISCYGRSQSEAIFRLFSTLLKYHNELSRSKVVLSDRQQSHFALLERWMKAVESRMTVREPVVMHSRRR